MISEWIGSDRVGCVIDARFTLQRWLGGAGDSGVFLTHIGGDEPRNAAIKLLPAGLADAESLLDQWDAAKRLSHQHLVRIFDSGQCRVDDCDLLYVVTERADEILAGVLPARPLTPGEVREMLGPVLDALSWLHAQGMVHGGLKPSNIMVVDEKIKLSIDRVQTAGPRVFPDLSPDIHDAPEAAGKITPAADVWSLGVLLVEALTQHPPRWDATRVAGPQIPASLPQPFAAIASGCLQLDPARRCTLSEIRSHLEASAPTTVPHAPVSEPETTPTAVAPLPQAAAPVPLEKAQVTVVRPEKPVEAHVDEAPAPTSAMLPLEAEASLPSIAPAEAPAEDTPKPSTPEGYIRRANAEASAATVQPPAGMAADVSPKNTSKPIGNRRATVLAAAMVLVAALLALAVALHHQAPPTPPARETAGKTSPAPHSQPPSSPAASSQAPSSQEPSPQSPAPAAPAASVASGPPIPGAVLHREMPDVSQNARDSIRGRLVVVVRAQVDPDGNVSDATFDYEGTSQYFASRTMDAARQWKFRPAQIGGRPVSSTWVLQFRYEQTGDDVTPIEKTP